MINLERNIFSELNYSDLLTKIRNMEISEDIRCYCQLTTDCMSIELNVFKDIKNKNIDTHYAICLKYGDFGWRTEYLSNTIDILKFKDKEQLFSNMEIFLLDYLNQNNLSNFIK
ncbi:TPA: hypothetical protein ACMU2U_001429 [Clostridioides difficile]|nr:hypothetical protein [Clostridioides difficile]MCI4304785.1 hypothetical protein [Clostridioides difficile]MCM4101589.1 hypothetical protein [Clostridioides difficile]HDF4164019.1 hypothetical protein [Clostridioides difficile]